MATKISRVPYAFVLSPKTIMFEWCLARIIVVDFPLLWENEFFAGHSRYDACVDVSK